MDEKVRTLYVFQSEDRLITHDGHVQLGCHNMTMEKFMSFERENIQYIETYWMPVDDASLISFRSAVSKKIFII